MARLGIGERIAIAIFGFLVVNRFCGGYAALLGLIAAAIWQISVWYDASQVWARRGVPTAPHWLFLGHMKEYGTKGFHVFDVECTKKYGKLYGSYLFTQPEIVIADEELLKKVLIKDFHNFTNRRNFELSKKALFNRMVSAMKDDEWKNTRSAITPAFTSGKLKVQPYDVKNDDRRDNMEPITIRKGFYIPTEIYVQNDICRRCRGFGFKTPKVSQTDYDWFNLFFPNKTKVTCEALDYAPAAGNKKKAKEKVAKMAAMKSNRYANRERNNQWVKPAGGRKAWQGNKK